MLDYIDNYVSRLATSSQLNLFPLKDDNLDITLGLEMKSLMGHVLDADNKYYIKLNIPSQNHTTSKFNTPACLLVTNIKS